MAFSISKGYTPASSQVADATAYNTDLSALFNTLTGLQDQTTTIGGLTITPSSNSTTRFVIQNAAGTELLSADTTNSSLKLKATAKLYFDGGGDTYSVESAANVFDVYVGGTNYLKFTHASTKVEVLGADLEIDAAKKVYFDGGGNTYIHEDIADRMTLVVGAANSLQLLATYASFVGDIVVPATKKLYVDGSASGNTYITERSADVMGLYGGGNLVIDVAAGFSRFYGPILVSGTGTAYLGDSSDYLGEINYKTLTDRGCLGWFDEGVELQDGRIVSDTEALLAIKKHPTKKTIYGKEMLDYKTFPKVSYKKAETKEKGILPRDKNDEPIGGQDGIEMTSMFSVMIGAIRELTHRIKVLEAK